MEIINRVELMDSKFQVMTESQILKLTQIKKKY